MTATVQCECKLDKPIWRKPPRDHQLTLHRTFLKRKGGLFKKAHELSVLCSVDVAVFIFGNNKKLYEYSSTDMGDLITRYQYVSRSHTGIARPKLILYSMAAQMSTKDPQTSMAAMMRMRTRRVTPRHHKPT